MSMGIVSVYRNILRCEFDELGLAQSVSLNRILTSWTIPYLSVCELLRDCYVFALSTLHLNLVN